MRVRGKWRGEPWTRGEVTDVAGRVLAVPDDRADDLTYDEDGVGSLLYDEWVRLHLGPGFAEVGAVRAATEAVQHARARLDEAVASARSAGASWESIGEAAGMSRQSAHERWGRRG
jgi:hypothetical protein